MWALSDFSESMWPRGEGASRDKATLVMKMDRRGGLSSGAAREKAAVRLRPCLESGPALIEFSTILEICYWCCPIM